MNLLKSFINKNFVLLCAGLAVFCVGIISGSIVAANMGAADATELKNSLSGMVSPNSVNTISFWDIVASESLNHLKPIAIMGLCAHSICLIPVSAFALGIRGYQLGFSVSFLCANFGFRGIVLTFVSSLVSYVIAMPVYIVLFVLTSRYAIVRSKNNGMRTNGFSLSAMLVGAYGILCVGSCIEGLLLPIFIDFFTA